MRVPEIWLFLQNCSIDCFRESNKQCPYRNAQGQSNIWHLWSRQLKCFEPPTQPVWWEFFFSEVCTWTRNPYLPQPLSSHTRRRTSIPAHNLLLPPIKIWRCWGGAPLCGTRGVRVIFRQLCLKPWNQTEAPHSVGFLLLKTVLLLSGSAQTPYTQAQGKKTNSAGRTTVKPWLCVCSVYGTLHNGSAKVAPPLDKVKRFHTSTFELFRKG